MMVLQEMAYVYIQCRIFTVPYALFKILFECFFVKTGCNQFLNLDTRAPNSELETTTKSFDQN